MPLKKKYIYIYIYIINCWKFPRSLFNKITCPSKKINCWNFRDCFNIYFFTCSSIFFFKYFQIFEKISRFWENFEIFRFWKKLRFLEIFWSPMFFFKSWSKKNVGEILVRIFFEYSFMTKSSYFVSPKSRIIFSDVKNKKLL